MNNQTRYGIKRELEFIEDRKRCICNTKLAGIIKDSEIDIHGWLKKQDLSNLTMTVFSK